MAAGTVGKLQPPATTMLPSTAPLYGAETPWLQPTLSDGSVLNRAELNERFWTWSAMATHTLMTNSVESRKTFFMAQMQAKGLWGFVLFVATVKETNFFKFFLELGFFLVGDVLKWGSVFAKVKAD